MKVDILKVVENRVLATSRENQLLVDEIHEKHMNEDLFLMIWDPYVNIVSIFNDYFPQRPYVNIELDDNKYIGELLAKIKAAKDRSKWEILHCKLIFKRLFRESKGDAMQLSTLEILAYIGFVGIPKSCIDWNTLLERFIPRRIVITHA
ncbi:hypothetical protein Golob_003933 [Gossypium lobatum]|uniref:Uncharacterized protein n=1 Tax=Gossypium lobatum TaxID=34289 RepID=A0A7J8N022_9ROSI|nr:hypothetical protein [Gossypium lobatum]